MNDPATSRFATAALHYPWEGSHAPVPAAPTSIPIEDWELMFDALVETLFRHAKEWFAEPDDDCRHLAEEARVHSLDCIESLRQLKEMLVREVDRRQSDRRFM